MHEAAHSHVAVGNRSLFLPGGDRGAVSCSPLEGDCRLRAGKTTQPGPQGSGFFLSAALRGRNTKGSNATHRASQFRFVKLAQRHDRYAEKISTNTKNIGAHEEYQPDS
jgi:hypothetical protein